MKYKKLFQTWAYYKKISDREDLKFSKRNKDTLQRYSIAALTGHLSLEICSE